VSTLARVLIVDDDAEVASTLQEAVVQLGYSAQVAGDGPEALRLFPEFRPDIVLLDLTMPEMPGQVVLERLRQLDSQLPVIMVTANADLELAKLTLALGALDYIMKPLDFEHLATLLETALVYRD